MGLKSAISALKPIQGFQKLQTNLSNFMTTPVDLFHMSNRRLDAIDRDAGLVRHFEFRRCGPRPDVGFNHFKDFAHKL